MNACADMSAGKRVMIVLGTVVAAFLVLVLLLFVSAAVVKGAVLLLAQLDSTDTVLLWIQENVPLAFGISFILLCCFTGLTLRLLSRRVFAGAATAIRHAFALLQHSS